MFFREKIGRKTSAPVLQLVDATRTPKGVRQHILVSLADMTIPVELRKPVAKRVSDLLHGIDPLVSVDPEVERLAEHVAQRIRAQGRWRTRPAPAPEATQDNPAVGRVLVDNVTHAEHAELGPVLAGMHAWDQLTLTPILTKCGFTREQIHYAMISIINRLADPVAENALPGWVGRTALPDLLENDNLRRVGKDCFYRIADKLSAHQTTIARALAEREADLFHLQRTLVLYDLTNTYFEGAAVHNPKAAYGGHSKEKRNDCPQLVVGLVLDGDGFVLDHRVHAGNTADSTTLLEMVTHLRDQHPGLGKPTVIVDGGLSCDDNLKALRDAGFDYLVAARRQQRDGYEEVFTTATFTSIKDRPSKLDVRVHAERRDDETLLFCRSESRAAKECAIHDTSAQRFETDLQRLHTRLANGRLKQPDKIQQALGRLLERHHRAARLYQVTVTPATKQAKASLTWKKTDDPTPTCGCYILRTSRTDLTADDIWRTYMTLLYAEEGFRTLKSDLGLRPVYHQVESRCDSHIWITILAYHLLHVLQYTSKKQGDSRSWKTIRRILRTHQICTTILPTVDGEVIHLRTAGQPDAEQKEIYRNLNLSLANLPVRKTIA